MKKYKAIVIGASAGGFDALNYIFKALPKHITTPIIVVQHLSPNYDSKLASILNEIVHMNVKQAEDKETILDNHIYVVPPNYHLLVEKDFSFSLSSEEKINFSRPSIDVLFETAADAYRQTLIGILLTGANSDGAIGLQTINKLGGYTIIQSPSEAYAKAMPESALKLFTPNQILNLKEIVATVSEISKLQGSTANDK